MTSSIIPPQKWTSAQYGGAWKEFWAYVGPIISLIGCYFLLAPQISVEPTVNLDPSQSLSTQLLIKNTGHVPIYNIRLAADLGGAKGPVYMGHLKPSRAMFQPIEVLAAGASVTRAIAAESFNVQAPDIIFKVIYDWPIIGKEATSQFHFSIKRGAAGFFLVPDLPPP